MAIFELIVKKLKTHNVEHFKSWLYTLSKNYCLEQLRKSNKTLTKNLKAKLVYSEQIFHPDIEDKSLDLKLLKACKEKLP